MGDFSDKLGTYEKGVGITKMPQKDLLGNAVLKGADTLRFGGVHVVALPQGYKAEDLEPVIKAVARSVGVEWSADAAIPEVSSVPLVTQEELNAPIVGVKNEYDDGESQEDEDE